jgi:hypothetical protein
MASRADIRLFTLQEANAAVEDLSQLLPAMRRSIVDIENAENRLAVLDLICDRAVSSENPDLKSYLSMKVSYHRQIHEFEGMITHLQASGYLLQDLERGIVHFPSRHRGKDVVLCWVEGEARVSHWHELDEMGVPEEEKRFDVEEWERF